MRIVTVPDPEMVIVNGRPDRVAALHQIAEAHGGILQPKAVVDAARNPNSPLHDAFEWNDSAAAEAYRLYQARQLIRVVVRYEQVGTKTVPCRVFVSLSNDRKDDDGGYRLVTNVLSDAEQRRQLLADAREEMVRFRDKYRALSELAEVFAAIDRVDTRELQDA
jgi:hypothetical protein